MHATMWEQTVQTGSEAKLDTCHWNRARFDEELRHERTNIHPEHWPADVRCISNKGFLYLGLDRNGRLYLDGKPVYTAKRWEWYERSLATVGLIVAGIAAGSAGVSAYVDLRQPSTPPGVCIPQETRAR